MATWCLCGPTALLPLPSPFRDVLTATTSCTRRRTKRTGNSCTRAIDATTRRTRNRDHASIGITSSPPQGKSSVCGFITGHGSTRVREVDTTATATAVAHRECCRRKCSIDPVFRSSLLPHGRTETNDRFLPLVCARNKLDIVQTDVVDDPTLQRSKNAICEKCNYNEAVFFQADEVRCMRARTGRRVCLPMIHNQILT